MSTATWIISKITRWSCVVQKKLGSFCQKFQAVRMLYLHHKFIPLMNNPPIARNHLAADRDMPPPALFRYHAMSRPSPFTHREFENSMIGQGMRTFNSSIGVSPEAWYLLTTYTTFCPGCRMMFSIDGFRAHTPQNRCPKPGAHYTVVPYHSKSS